MESQELCLQSACLSSLPWKSACVELEAKVEAENSGSALLEAAAPGSAVPAGCTQGWWDAASRMPLWCAWEWAPFHGWHARITMIPSS